MGAETFQPSSLRRLKTIQGLLEEKRAVLGALDVEIIESCPLEDVEQETVDSEEISESIVECIEQIKSVVTRTEVISEASVARESRNVSPRDETVRTNNSNESGAPAVERTRSGSVPTVNESLQFNELPVTLKPKLPKIELPKFNGDVTKFCSFWESFQSSVDRNPNLSTIDKFSYLKALLEGSAARSVQGFALTEANYTAATDILRERFGRKQQIISGHMDDLLRIPSCSSDRTTHLLLVYDKVHANVRGLEALGIEANQYGSFLIPIVMAKLPSDVRL